MATKPRKSKPTSSQRALIVGVSEYPNPKDRLAAVAADVREMAKALSSKHGIFPAKGVTVLADKQATRDNVLAALRSVFDGPSIETVFVYLAGHGFGIGRRYYYVAYDTTSEATAVPLTEIKAMFDQTKSRRAFLWLDFCHAGGILARGDSDDMDAIKREIGIVSGHGKVIVAACTSAQKSYESSSIGHGYFTHALLRGLRGEAKSAQGEVTAHSLYEFIDHQVANPRQQPVFFGETTGRIVLAHYPEGAPSTAKKPPTSKSARPKAKSSTKKAGTWVMLGDTFFLAETVRHGSDNKLEIRATTKSGSEAAVFASLRPGRYGGGSSLPFAANNDAHVVRVQSVESELAGEQQVWTLTLMCDDSGLGGEAEMTYKVGGNTYSPDDIARQRAGRILLNDPPPRTGPRRGFSSEESILGWIEGSGRYPVNECVVRSLFGSHGKNPNWKAFARLKAVFSLKAAGVVEHVLDLSIGPVRANQVMVKFRGQRNARYGGPETFIEITGVCPLD
jgi:uncharacterized caspase-like protein